MMWLALSLVVLSLAFAMGPVRFPVRAALHPLGPDVAKRFEWPVLAGLFAGLAAAVVLSPSAGISPLLTASLALLLLMAASDAAWRWLPPVWTALLALIGFITLIYNGTLIPFILQAGAVIAGLMAVRHAFFWWRGVEALGMGDVWLAGALALHLGAPVTLQVLGLAACLGLLIYVLSSLILPPARRRMGVAFGTHICFISAIALSWLTYFPLSTYS